MSTLPTAILISGNGSNLQAIIDAELPIDIRVVISDREDAYGLERTRHAGIATQVITKHDYADREEYDQALQDYLEQHQVELIVLAGFMRILTPEFVKHFHGKILNIHPSLLPKYRGLDTYRKVLAAGDSMYGTSVHFVTEDLDGGPVIIQSSCEVTANDDEESLKQKVQAMEHRLYPKVINWFAEGRLVLRDNRVWFDEELLPACGMQVTESTI